jgi:hypothetical protein
MHKPYEVIIPDDSIAPLQKKNLMSAICVSAFFHLKEKEDIIVVNEKDFFMEIIKIPFFQSNKIFYLFNRSLFSINTKV